MTRKFFDKRLHFFPDYAGKKRLESSQKRIFDRINIDLWIFGLYQHEYV